jgi:hypothetical protein
MAEERHGAHDAGRTLVAVIAAQGRKEMRASFAANKRLPAGQAMGRVNNIRMARRTAGNLKRSMFVGQPGASLLFGRWFWLVLCQEIEDRLFQKVIMTLRKFNRKDFEPLHQLRLDGCGVMTPLLFHVFCISHAQH